MAIKKYRCTINWLNGCEFFDVIVKANTERKAKIIAKEKVIKEKGNLSAWYVVVKKLRRIEQMDNNNLTRARQCCLRRDNLCGKTSSCELCSYMKNIKELWIKFCDTPIQYSKTGCITEEFNSFPIGTFRADIVDWFYKTFEVDIDALKEMTGRYDNKNSEDIPEYIKESNRIKKETCKSCMEQLKDILSDKQLEQFEDVFYSAINGYILKRKESANGNR